jgi:hypothetical protein
LNARYYVGRLDVPWMERVYGDAEGIGIYRNHRAVPRAFATSRFRSFSDTPDISRWIMTPLFEPDESLLLLTKDLEILDSSFRDELEDEFQGIRVHARHYSMEWERHEAATRDETERRRIRQHRPPWGWGVGDLADLTIHPQEPLEDCYLIVGYYPAGSSASRLEVTLESEGESRSHSLYLPIMGEGAGDSGSKHKAALSLGPLASRAYRLSFTRTEECAAKLDSLRISRHPPESAPVPGRVEITGFEPNAISLRARVERASFVVVSEVYYPGWEAYVDGVPAPILAGNHILRAIPVAAGEHDIQLRYRPASFRRGLLLSLITLAAIAVFCVFRRRPQPEPRSSEARSR